MTKPSVWKMIKEAVEHFNGKASNSDIKKYINKKWEGVNNRTISDQIHVLTVNSKSRINYNINKVPRLTNSGSLYDLLYTTGRGQVVLYNSTEHGIWEIYKDGSNKLRVRQFGNNSIPKTYLFLWNPKKWDWKSLEQEIDILNSNGSFTRRWSCGKTKSIQPGDRIFLIKVGTEPKGIIGSGFAVSETFCDEHWGSENKNTNYINIEFDILLNPNNKKILTVDKLKVGNLSKQNWQPMASGISIRPVLVDELEEIWFNFLTAQKFKYNPFIPKENNPQKTYREGTPNQILATIYERNPYARKKCLEHFGYTCFVCDFNFEKKYGQIGKSFIHVHHLTQIAKVGQTYEIDPINDLRPVCPNCHSIIHRHKIPLSINELKKIINENAD